MCGGASSDQTQISDEQQAFYKQLTDQYSTIFGQNQAITGALTKAFTPILAAGPNQTGFDPAEENALRTQNTEGVATNYAQAQRATANALAARGGGNDLLPSSVDANLIANNANKAAAARSAGDLGITEANYTQGRQNWMSAAGVLGSTAGLLNPNSYSASATDAGGAAASEANAITAQNNSIWNSAIGALGGLAGSAVGGWAAGGFKNPFAKTASAPTSGPAYLPNYQPFQSMYPLMPSP